MPVADGTSIADATGLSEDLVLYAMARARQGERDCRRELGDALYDELASRPKDDQAREDLVEAESLLTFAHALPFGNLSPDDKGTLTRARGRDQSRRETMSQRELAAYQRQYRQQADTILDDLSEEGDADFLPIAAV